MEIERILLVNSPIDDEEGRKQAVNTRSFPPLGLLTIAARLKQTFPNIQTKVIDGDLIGKEAIEKIIKSFVPQIVGASALTPTYKSALEIARYSKETGVQYVVFGNDHVSFFPERVLEKRQDVSFIIKGDDGDVDFTNLVSALAGDSDPFLTVANLYGRQNGAVRCSKSRTYRLKEKLAKLEYWPDLTLLDEGFYCRYQRNYNEKFGSFHGKKLIKPFIINSAKGCYKAYDRCLYCSIFDLTYQRGNVEAFWKAVENYHEKYGVNFFFEVCDNFAPLRTFRKELLCSMPSWFSDSEIEFAVYADANTICKDPEIVQDFKRLHIKRVNMGLDTGDPESLSTVKGFRNGDLNRRAVETLTSQGIQIHSSFVLGTAGETEQSLAKTLRFIHELLDNENVIAIEISPLFPLPCSPAWDLFLGDLKYFHSKDGLSCLIRKARLEPLALESVWNVTRAHFLNEDAIDLNLASQLWADNFTCVGYDVVAKTTSAINEQIKASGKVGGGFV